jgi:ribosomal protein S18
MFTPISRYEKVKRFQKKLKKYDIHWRNVELLRQFTTPYGNIKHRWANRLSPCDQKRVAAVIKTSRHSCAMPNYGRTLHANKRNLTNLEEEVK